MFDLYLLLENPGVVDLVMFSKRSAMFASERPVISTAYLGGVVMIASVPCGLLAQPRSMDDLSGEIAGLVHRFQVRCSE